MSDQVLVVTQQQSLVVHDGSVATTLTRTVQTQTTLLGAGSQGPPGPSGTGDANFHYPQPVVSAVWTINHNLNKFPSVTIIDSTGTEVEGALTYNGPNQLTVTFTSPFSGDAYLN